MNKDIKMELEGNKGLIYLYDGNKKIGLLTFLLEDNVMVADHTEVSEEYKGQGLARELVNYMVDYARSNHYKIKPVCSYIKKVFEKDDSLNDVK